MKNLTPEQLSLHLSHGDWVAMKNTDGNWKVFMYETQEWGFQGTTTRCSIEESLESGLISPSYSPEQITEDFTEYQIIKRPPVLMEPGDKCQIIDTPELRKIAEEERWSDEKKIEELKALLEKQGLDLEDRGDESEWGSIQIWKELEAFMKQYGKYIRKYIRKQTIEECIEVVDSYWDDEAPIPETVEQLRALNELE